VLHPFCISVCFAENLLDELAEKRDVSAEDRQGPIRIKFIADEKNGGMTHYLCLIAIKFTPT